MLVEEAYGMGQQMGIGVVDVGVEGSIRAVQMVLATQALWIVVMNAMNVMIIVMFSVVQINNVENKRVTQLWLMS
ncbi:MAG: hypothetical protein AB2794_09655 [Candidatus Thiodiazotropha endolucinida]